MIQELTCLNTRQMARQPLASATHPSFTPLDDSDREAAAHFAEAVAEGRGKAQAASLRDAKAELRAKLLIGVADAWELVPASRICYTSAFDDPNLPGTMKTTIVLKPVLCGTEITAVQEGIPDFIPTEMCYLGWQESLAQLATLVEPEIAG